MGQPLPFKTTGATQKLVFLNALIRDIETLEVMMEAGLFEKDVIRIGAEQEFCIVNNNWRPATNNVKLLEVLKDSDFTSELATYNIELNCIPLELKTNCYQELENYIIRKYNQANSAAAQLESRVLLAGILPTISRKEITLDYLTPLPRYQHLNKVLRQQRGSSFDLYLKGVDELHIKHDNILFEACNTSFQAHLQVDVNEFAEAYNWAQAIAGPVLAAATNSPLLFGKELWSEIRIALFQQSIETRKSMEEIRTEQPRVTFGNKWIKQSVTEIYKDDISSFDILITLPNPENSIEAMADGRIPLLQALRLYNGTIYRWNRPCYGIYQGKPHLRIENRYMPAGPSIRDEVANLAFWSGLMVGRPDDAKFLPQTTSFRDIQSNFYKAARSGIESVFIWQGKEINAKDLILNELLPIAYQGLRKMQIHETDIYTYLGTIEKRLLSQTGSQWQVHNFRNLRQKLSPSDAAISLTVAMWENQQAQAPVHEWNHINLDHAMHYLLGNFHRVYQLMSTNLITVLPDDSLLLVEKIMEWHQFHHVLIEDKKGNLSGVITKSSLLAIKEQNIDLERNKVKSWMKSQLQVVSPDALITDALHQMRQHRITSLPVVEQGKLVGIVTANDMLRWLEHRKG